MAESLITKAMRLNKPYVLPKALPSGDDVTIACDWLKQGGYLPVRVRKYLISALPVFVVMLAIEEAKHTRGRRRSPYKMFQLAVVKALVVNDGASVKEALIATFEPKTANDFERVAKAYRSRKVNLAYMAPDNMLDAARERLDRKTGNK